MCDLNIGLMKCGRILWRKAEETRKDFNIVLIHQDKKFFTPELFKVTLQTQSHRSFITGQCLNSVRIFEYIYHIGCAISLHTIMISGLILGGTKFEQKKRTVFFTLVDPMNKEHKDPGTVDLKTPRLARYVQTAWKKHQNTV